MITLGPHYETDFVNAAAWLMPASLFLQIGYFHPIFDHYGEDVEFIARLRSRGLKVIIDPHSFIIHDRDQKRKNSQFHQYGDNLKRTLLQRIVSKQLSMNGALITYLKVGVYNILTFRLSRLPNLLKGYKWLKSKHAELRSIQNDSLFSGLNR